MRILPVIALIALAACGKDGESDDAPTFTEVRDEVFVPSCALAGCHGDQPGEAGLYLGADMDLGQLVNEPSIDDPEQIRVIPGDPDNSYLIKKMERAPDIYGDPMPPPFGADEDTVELVRAWIAAGAKDN